MTRFDRLIKMILLHEGKLANDKDDAGGITNYGVSLRFAAATGDFELFDADHDGDIDAFDIVALTPERASAAYREYFYDVMQINQIADELLAAHLLDFAVNAGCSRAAKFLQRIAGATPDGVIGKDTLSKANARPGIGEKYAAARREYYIVISRRNRNGKFLRDWLYRVKHTTHFVANESK